MRLIFDKEIEFLKEKLGIRIPSKQCFMDRMCVKSQDIEGNWHTFYKIRAKDMELSLIKDNTDKLKEKKLLTWDKLIEVNKNKLKTLENGSIDVIRENIDKFDGFEIYVPVSGGKDSSITHYLVDKVSKGYKTVFSNTTNETHHTYKYIKSNYPNARVITPKEGFYTFVERTGFIPTRFARACCTVQKEIPMTEQLEKDDKILFFMGMRKAESNNRSTYETEWKNHRWRNREWQGILPILEWSDLDVLLFMLYREIPFNPIYEFGYGRCGCTNCCFRSDYELVLNKHFLNSYHNRWQLILEKDFINNKKSPVLNCSLEEYKNGAWKSGRVRDEVTDEIIREFAKSQGLDIKVAEKYFNKKCTCCGKKIKSLDIALSMKFYGRNIETFKCIKCISKELNVTTKELKNRAKIFKNDGCDLF